MTRITNQQMLANLEASGIEADRAKFPKETRRKSSNEESRNQQYLVKWWAAVCTGYGLPEIALMAFPLQGKRTEQNGARMKAEGCRKGTLDMLLMVPRRGKPALWIENKRPSGIVTDEQNEMLQFLMTQGCQVAVCRTVQDAQRVITEYLS